MKFALCLYGSVRTFTNPIVRERYKSHFMASINSLEGSYDTFVILMRQPNGQNHRARTTEHCSLSNEDLMHMCVDVFGPLTHFEVMEDNKDVFDAASPHAKQLMGINAVFECAIKHMDYDYYMRIRPDFYRHKPFDHSVLVHDTVVTAYKRDAPASDMFFIVPKSLFHSWWISQIQCTMKQVNYSCEFVIFKNVKVYQHPQIQSALQRQNKVDSWQ